MKPHDTFLELAAIAIDFPLASADRGRLEQHLAGCAACGRTAHELRGDALALAHLPPVMLPERRGAEILAAALHPPVVRNPVRLLVVAALLGLLVLGSLAVGSEMLRRMDQDDLGVVLPVPTQAASPEPAPSATPPAPGAELSLGEVWAPASMPVVADRPIGQLEAVTAGGPGFVAVGRGCQADGLACEFVAWTSTDGQAWQRVPASDALATSGLFMTSGPELGMFDVAAGGPGVVAVGYAARPEMEATAWFSPDGANWERFILGDAGSTRIHAVTWDGRQFVAVGEDRGEWDGTLEGMAKARARAAAWISPDGRTWTQVPHSESLDAGSFKDTTEDPSTGGMADVIAGPGGLVAVGSTCRSTPPTAPPACEPAIWSSADGTSWERVAGVPGRSGWLKAIATSGSGYVAVGATQTCDPSVSTDPWGCPALVLTSPDGQTWTQQPFEQPGDLRTLTAIGGRYFATAPFGPSTVWTSSDGAVWTPADVQGGPTTAGSGNNAAWHFAATPDTAVWIGTPPQMRNPAAWVSGGQ